MFVCPDFKFETAFNVEIVAEDDSFIFGVYAMFFIVADDSWDKGYGIAGILSYS